MQDTLIDELIPALLRAAGEVPGTAIGNLNCAERLNLISSTDGWLAVRRLGKRIVHEYMKSEEDMLTALNQAGVFSHELVSTYENLRRYARDHLGLTPTAP